MSFRHYLIGVLFLGIVLVVTGCREPAATAPAPANLAGSLTVFVPCGVAGPYGEIKALFEKRYPGVKVSQVVANIDVQTKMIHDGKASPDVWLALGDREMQWVTAAGKIAGQPVTFAYNSIAFMVAKNNPLGIESVPDLTKAGVRTIALPTESNSSGYYAKKAFEKAGVWDKVQKKLWITDQPSMVKAQLAAGKADVGVVYYPCTREGTIGGKPQELPGKVQLLGKLPEDLVGRIPAQAAVLQGAQNPRAAQAFLRMLTEDAVQDIWEKWAFDRATQPASGARITLYAYCAAGLRPMLDQAFEAYQKLKPNVRIDAGYAGSGCLLSQLAFGKRGDLYMPGEAYYLDQARKRNFLAGEKLVGYFEPVLLVQKGNPKGIRTVADLARRGVDVGLGEPEAAAVGRAAEALLTKAGIYEKVKPNVVLRAGNVPELGNAVKLKSVDVAIVWRITAAQYPKDCDMVAIPASLYQPSPASCALLKFSKQQAEAQAFMDFLTGPQGQAIVKKSGMLPAK
jgi:molybdate transport system substrate-binding protein